MCVMPTSEAEEEGPLVPDQTGLHRETLSPQKPKKRPVKLGGKKTENGGKAQTKRYETKRKNSKNTSKLVL